MGASIGGYRHYFVKTYEEVRRRKRLCVMVMSRSAVSVAAIFLAGCGDIVDSTYASQTDARVSGAIAAGWIPEWIPSSAFHIREVHDLDTNESALAFSLSGGTWTAPAHCAPTEGGARAGSKFSRSWLPSNAEMSSKFRVFECSGQLAPQMHEALAVSLDNSYVVRWRAYAR